MPVLTAPSHDAGGPNALGTAGLFLGAMALGSALGLAAPDAASQVTGWTDVTLLALIFLLFFELRFDGVLRAFGNVRFLAVAWMANFMIVPVIGFAIASVLVSGQPLLFAGLMIYFLAPCTDWFLGFTRLARGDTELGAALIPVNMISQLALFPVWLWLFAPSTGLVDFGALPGLLFQWFLLPMALAQLLRALTQRFLEEAVVSGLFDRTSRVTPLVLAALITQLFAGHIDGISANAEVFCLVALAVLAFFTLTFAVGLWLRNVAHLGYPQHALLSMTMAARNAPLMLALSAVALPDQPLVLAVIAFGMLVEIPHLTLLRHLLLRRRARHNPPPEPVT